MAKKKKVMYYIPGALALLVGIAAFCMMFLPAITYNAAESSSDGWTGAQLIFGYKETILSQEITVLNFNFVALLAYFLPLIGGLLALISKNGFLTKIITTACFVVSAVLLFTIVAYSGLGRVNVENEGLGSLVAPIINAIYDAIDETKGLGIGAIIGGILSVVGAVLCFFKGTIAKLFH